MVVEFTGAGRRCRFADIVHRALIPIIYFFHHVKGLLRCEDDPKKHSLKDRGATCSFVMHSVVEILFLQL